MKNVQLGTSLVGDSQPVYIIAEIGGNFRTFEEAKNLIQLAREANVDAVKLQTYRAETISSKLATYDMPNTGNANQFALFKKYEVDFALHKDIWDYCREIGLFVFSTPSHITDVQMLEELGCEAYKIGSDDACNLPFLEEVASTGRPVVMSTGMCTMNEVREAVSTMLSTGNDDIVLLHCVTNYPAEEKHTNLSVIPRMKSEFGLPVGYSDHTLNNTCCLAATALGANVIEKHFTHDKNADGPDHMLSANPEELNELVRDIRCIERALGDGVKRPSDGEKTTRINNRKSIVAIADIPKGTRITKEMLAIKRPGYGVQPKYWEVVQGRVAREDIKCEEPLEWLKI